MPETLNPCPFCGAPAELKEIGGRRTAKCTKECVGIRIFNEQNKPVKVWNTCVDERPKGEWKLEA